MGTLIAVTGFALVATMTPGGATALATASGANFGLRRSVPFIVGIALGLSLLGGAGALGLAALVLAIPSLELALRALGSGYLLWLAWRIGRSGSPQREAHVTAPVGVFGGMLLLWLNPKAWALAVGAAATFGEKASSPMALAVAFAIVFGVCAAISMTLWSATGLMLSRVLRTDRHWRWVNAALGLLLALSVLPMWVGR
ncbi:amino acid transporter [Spiribacter halobius]|uniref:Amino acid transporter n=1 Tax=Sediminicurvatus halobius TaxID=2182432 RepID=A0A2U2MYG7_9GAMM|nr:amino acid transporter [Spiribacter halobius]